MRSSPKPQESPRFLSAGPKRDCKQIGTQPAERNGTEHPAAACQTRKKPLISIAFTAAIAAEQNEPSACSLCFRSERNLPFNVGRLDTAWGIFLIKRIVRNAYFDLIG